MVNFTLSSAVQLPLALLLNVVPAGSLSQSSCLGAMGNQRAGSVTLPSPTSGPHSGCFLQQGPSPEAPRRREPGMGRMPRHSQMARAKAGPLASRRLCFEEPPS